MSERKFDPAVIAGFIAEASGYLPEIAQGIEAYLSNRSNPGPLETACRHTQTIRGAASVLGFDPLSNVAARLEEMIHDLGGQLTLSRDAAQRLRETAAQLSDCLAEVARRHSLTDASGPVSLSRVDLSPGHVLTEAEAAGPQPEPESPPPAPVDLYDDILEVAGPDWSPEPEAVSFTETEPAQVIDSPVERLPEATAPTLPDADVLPVAQFVRVPLARLDELGNLAGELGIVRTAFEQRLADLARQLDELRFSSERLRHISATLETEYAAALPGGHNLRLMPVASTTPGFTEFDSEQSAEFHLLSRELSEVTGDVQALRQELTTLAGEFDSLLGRQRRLSGEVQDRLMHLRMVPLSTLATRLHRTVRSVAAPQGRQVELLFSGEDTQLDKTVIEALADPLQHIVRNAVDHGIETPEQRLALGKPARGRIHIAAWREGAEVLIQIRDDGRGLEADKLRAAAVRHGLAGSRDEAARMTDEELWPLIFQPGFSTCEQVSENSGRGVGLDIVQSAVRQLEGSIAVEPQPGPGAAFIIRLPMTRAVMQALLVKSDGQTYAIPLGGVTQILRVEPEAMQGAGDAPALNLNGQETPLLWLSDLLRPGTACRQNAENQIALVFRTGGRQFGLLVDQIIGGREIVVRSLDAHLRRMRGLTAATLMDDGRVVLILNVPELASDSFNAAAQSETICFTEAAAAVQAELTVS